MNDSREARDGYLAFLEALVEEAGEIALKHFRNDPVVTDKNPSGDLFDPVTQADREVEVFIRQKIADAYPDHAIIGEELGGQSKAGALTWLIDPIDGTRGFIAGTPMWGVLTGVQQGEQCLAGAMRQPCLRETYLGDGETAYFAQGGRRVPLRTRRRDGLGEAVVCCTHPYMYPTAEAREKFMGVMARCQFSRFGTECLGYGMLAAGYVDLVVEGGLCPYDIAPLIPIIEGAGGIVTDWQGNAAAGGGLIVAAAHRKLHDEALELLN